MSHHSSSNTAKYAIAVMVTIFLTLAIPSISAQKLSAPASGAYFGAAANPDQGLQDPEMQAETLESSATGIGRTLAFHMHYYGWAVSGGGATFPDKYMTDDYNRGRIPVVSWTCLHPDAEIAAGTYDADIHTETAAIKAFPGRIMLRWFWEMNNDGATPSAGIYCMGNGDPLATQQQNFIAAWKHIWQVFSNDGVTNVTWLWNPAGTANGAAGFYPGPTYVDWIGDDDYGYITGQNPSGGFPGVASGFYNTFSSYGKPMMFGETGGCPTVNASYINQAASDLPSKYPDFKAFMYWDSVGTYTGCPASSSSPWVFTTTGLAAFKSMGALAYFSATP